MTEITITKEDLVDFIKWNSNAPVSVLRRSSKEELINFLKTNPEAWNRFLNSIDKYRHCRKMEKMLAKF